MNTNKEARLITENLPCFLWSKLSQALEPHIGESLGTPPPTAEMIGLCQNLETDLIRCFGDSMPESDKKRILNINREIIRCLSH